MTEQDKNKRKEMEKSLAHYALAFADKFNFHVFPLREGQKTPATKNGFKDSTKDQDTILDFWRGSLPGANVGIRTGWLSGGLLVIDIDLPKKEGDIDGAESLIRLEAELGKLPVTLTVKTPSGGIHYYFRMDGSLPFPTICEDFGKVVLEDKSLKTCIDIRGEGGYVVAPGSITEKGTYQFGGTAAEGDDPVATLSLTWQNALRDGMPCVTTPTKAEEGLVKVEEKIKPSTQTTVLGRLKEMCAGETAPFQAAVLKTLIGEFGKEACEKEFGEWKTGTDGMPRANGGFSAHYAEARAESTSQTSSSKATTVNKTSPTNSSNGSGGKRKRKNRNAEDLNDQHIECWLTWMLPPTTRDEWLKVGMALHDYDGGGNDGLALWEKWSQIWWNSNEPRDQAKLVAQYNAFRVERDSEVTEITIYHLAREGVVARLNSRIAFRLDSPRAECFEYIPGKIIASLPEKLEVEYSNQVFYTLDAEGKAKRTNPFTFWLHAPGRQDIVGVTAHLDHTQVFVRGTDGYKRLNIWKGLARPGKPGGCKLFKQFLHETICNRRDDVYNWLWKWLAYKVQYPLSTSRSAVILYGEKGTGKDLFFSYLAKAVGEDNCKMFEEKQQLEAKHNTERVGRLFECSNEVLFMSDARDENKMKPFVTQEKITIEPKFAQQYEIPKFSAFLIFTNDKQPLRVTDDERRYTFIKPSHKYAKGFTDEATRQGYYGPIGAEKDGDGPSSLLAELLETELGAYLPFPGFDTSEATQLMLGTSKGEDEWLGEIIEAGQFPIGVSEVRSSGEKNITFLKNSAQEYARTFSEKYRIRAKSGMAVNLLSTRLGLKAVGKGKMSLALPSLYDLRVRWLKLYPKSNGFQYREGWEIEEWDFSAITKNGDVAARIKDTEYFVPFATEKGERVN